VAIDNSDKYKDSNLNSFTINGKTVYLQQILTQSIESYNLNSFELDTITFIHNWISGQQVFSIKTSGSTGPPRMFTFTRGQLEKSAIRTISYFNLKPGDSILTCLNPSFVAGMMMLVRAFVGKLKLIIVTPSSNPLADIDNKKIDFVALTPNQIDHAIEKSFYQLNQINKILVGGANLHPDLEQKLSVFQTSVYHSYAMTETLTHIAIRHVNGVAKSKIYHALEGISFSQDDRSCLIIHDSWLGIEKLTTNDIVELIDEHSFEWIGRYDNVINTGGIKIYTEEVENEIRQILHDLELTNNYCILSVPDPKLTNKMVLLIESAGGTVTDKNAVLQVLKNRLPRYHNPKEIILVPEIILTATGKIDRIRNADMYLANTNQK